MSKMFWQVKTQDQQALGETIRVFRMAKGWSQEEFAHQVNLHRTYIGSVERGERNISLENIIAIAGVLGLRASTLLKKAGL